MSALHAPAPAGAAPANEAAPAAAHAIRRLGRHDLPAVERHLLSLGPADRRKRFLSPFDDGAIARYVGRMDAGRAVLVGARRRGADGQLAGIAEAHPVADASRTVEVAVSVHPYHRREGLGRRLAAEAVARAFAEGANAAVFLFAPENRAIGRRAASLGARITGLGRAVLLAEAPPAAALKRRLERRGGGCVARRFEAGHRGAALVSARSPARPAQGAGRDGAPWRAGGACPFSALEEELPFPCPIPAHHPATTTPRHGRRTRSTPARGSAMCT